MVATFVLYPIVVCVTSVAWIAGFAVLSSWLFPATSSSQFPTVEAYWADFKRRQLICRELHLLYGIVIGLNAALFACLFMNLPVWPVFILFGTLEIAWLLINYVLWPPALQNYTEWPQLGLAVASAALAGVVCLVLGASLTPLVAGSILAGIGFLVLTPL